MIIKVALTLVGGSALLALDAPNAAAQSYPPYQDMDRTSDERRGNGGGNAPRSPDSGVQNVHGYPVPSIPNGEYVYDMLRNMRELGRNAQSRADRQRQTGNRPAGPSPAGTRYGTRSSDVNRSHNVRSAGTGATNTRIAVPSNADGQSSQRGGQARSASNVRSQTQEVSATTAAVLAASDEAAAAAEVAVREANR